MALSLPDFLTLCSLPLGYSVWAIHDAGAS
jgi:hypothetical protein